MFQETKIDYLKRKQRRVPNPATEGEKWWNGVMMIPERVPECSTCKSVYETVIQDINKSNVIVFTCSKYCLWNEWFCTKIRQKGHMGNVVYKSGERRCTQGK